MSKIPIDFRTYTDPGVYIEAITPPVLFTAAIEPTILAIVGEALSQRTVSESAVLTSTGATQLSTQGAFPHTVNASDRLLGTQYVSAMVATLDADVSNAATAWTVTTTDDALLPSTPWVAKIDDELVTVSSATAGSAQTWTVARGASSTTAVAHKAKQVINDATTYSSVESFDVAKLNAPVSRSITTVSVSESTGVQIVSLSGYASTNSFKLTYNGIETATITRGTNATAAGVKAALEALAAITTVDVTGTTDAGPFTIKFRSPNANVGLLSVTSGTGGTTGTVAKRGVLSGTYLDVEGERMKVTAVTGTAPQTVTVVRGVRGTTAKQHGAVEVFENAGADYTVTLGPGANSAIGDTDDAISLGILDTVRVADGTYLNVSFEATDAVQFSPGFFNDLDSVRDKYGDPLDANGQILSELTLAAQLAFSNGATQLILVASNAEDSHPIQDAIDKLEFEQSVNVVTVASGNTADVAYLRGHVDRMSDQGLLRRAFIGLDGTQSPVPDPDDFIALAQQTADERVSLVGPGRFKMDNGTATNIVVPGYLAAAAVAGLHAGQAPSEPLTRKQVFGFTGVDDQGSSSKIFEMQSKGVLVLYQDRLGRIIIKHGLTTDMTSPYTREISVVAARDRLRDFVLETLDGGQLVGSAMTTETPQLVMSAVTNALEEAMRQNLIADYADVLFRLPADNPTGIQIRFSYRPSLPLNYIHVQFVVDTSSQTVEFQTIQDDQSTV